MFEEYVQFVRKLESNPGEVIVGAQFEEVNRLATQLGELVSSLKKKLFYRCEHEGGDDHRTKVVSVNTRLLHGVLGKIDESCELFARVYEDIGDGGMGEHAPDRANYLEELGDDGWFTTLILDTLSFTPEQVMKANTDKLTLRHGDKFNKDNAETRDRAAERESLEANV